MAPSAELPDVAVLLAAAVERVTPAHRPLLIALAERMAASRYREWSEVADDASRRGELLACAAREEQIAGQVESLYPEAAGIQRDLVAKNPDLPENSRQLFEGRPLPEQYTLQARGERAGAATWRRLAERAEAETARRIFLECAELEERNALVLEAILAGEPPPGSGGSA